MIAYTLINIIIINQTFIKRINHNCALICWTFVKSSYSIYNIVFDSNKNKCLRIKKECLDMFFDSISFGNVFHRVAEYELMRRLPRRMVLFLLGISDVVDADRRGLVGVYQLNSSHKYVGDRLCNDLNVMINILNWQRLLMGSQCSVLSIGVMCEWRDVLLIRRVAVLSVSCNLLMLFIGRPTNKAL